MHDFPRHSFVAIGLSLPFVIIGYVLYVTISADQDLTSAGQRALPTLRLIVVVTRHGNRAPLQSLNDDAYWPYGLEELTNVGRRQMYQLGVRLRGLYHGFLRGIYSASDLYATSTLVNRTIQSALCLLAGLYPPGGYQVWNQALPWQPIPVFTDSPDKTKEMANNDCSRISQEVTSSLQNFTARNSANMSAIRNAIAPYVKGAQNMSLTDFRYLVDAMMSEQVEGFPLPEWTKTVYTPPTVHLYSQAVIAKYLQTVTMIRPLIGPLFDRLLEIFFRKANVTLAPDRQIYFFSGHDTTLMALQAVLGTPLEDIDVVYPASAMVFELHQRQTTGVHYIQVLYIDGKTVAEPRSLNIRGCGIPCELNQLANLTKPFCDVDFQAECTLQ